VLTRLVRGRRAQPWLPCPPQGLAELREQIAARLVQHGIAAGAANIVTTYGASQAFDLLARLLLAPGTRYWWRIPATSCCSSSCARSTCG